MSFEVIEHWPGSVDRSEEPRRVVVETPAEALEIAWIKEKGRCVVDYPYVMHNEWVVACLRETKPVV